MFWIFSLHQTGKKHIIKSFKTLNWQVCVKNLCICLQCLNVSLKMRIWQQQVWDFWEKAHVCPVHGCCKYSMAVLQVRGRRSSSRRSQNSSLGGVRKEKLPSQDSDGGAAEGRYVEDGHNVTTIWPLLCLNGFP